MFSLSQMMSSSHWPKTNSSAASSTAAAAAAAEPGVFAADLAPPLATEVAVFCSDWSGSRCPFPSG